MHNLKHTNTNKMRHIVFIIALLTVISTGYAQKVPRIKKKEFYILDDGFREAWKNVRKGNRAYRKGKKGSYRIAVQYYKKALEYNPDNPELAYKAGVSGINVSQNEFALKNLSNAYLLKPEVTKDILYWYAYAQHRNSEFSDAIFNYEEYMNSLSRFKLKRQKELLEKRIKECESGKELKEKPVRVLIDNLGDGINTEYPEYGPVFIKMDSVVYFTSRRPSTTRGKRSPTNYEFYEDIYYTSFKDGKWHEPANVGKPVNKKGNDAVLAISASGQEMLIYRGKKKQGNIYITNYRERAEKWKKPKKIFKKVNTKKYKETTLTFSNDSTVVYFVSERKKGEGRRDIYVMKRARGKQNSRWRKPQNLGSTINTPFNEESVFLGRNDSTLYFASQGHNSMGGYDIFKSTLLYDGRWSEPENLGFPVNSPDDEMFFSLEDNNRFGYFASKSNLSKGDFDIFSIVFLGPEKELIKEADEQLLAYFVKPVPEVSLEEPIFIKTMRLTVVTGTVTSYNDSKPLQANIEIIDNETNETLQIIQTNSQTGEYTVLLPSGKNYGMTANADGFMFHSENFNIPEASEYQEIDKDIQLLSIDPGSKVVLKNVFFDSGKSELRPQSYPELTRLAKVFQLYPNLIVEISGHTDNRGRKSTNKRLSKERAQSVVNYMISIGVPEKQLVAVGYGPDQPVATNKTEEGRQLNRRVEAKVLSK